MLQEYFNKLRHYGPTGRTISNYVDDSLISSAENGLAEVGKVLPLVAEMGRAEEARRHHF